jgi:hypothetical protein
MNLHTGIHSSKLSIAPATLPSICIHCLMGPNHQCGCSIWCRVSAGRHVPSSQTDNDCGMSGVVQSWQTTCYSHGTALLPW